jgi:competence protein ComEC
MSLNDGFLHVYFFDVGQGDSLLIQTPGNEYVLIDGGPDDTVLQELGNVLPFYVKTIDVVVLTHPHADHVNGLVEVLKKYKVKQVLLTGASYGDAGYAKFLNLINEKNIDTIFTGSGFDLALGDVVFDLLYPFESVQGKKFTNINNSSLAIRIIYGDFELFISGDLEVEGEEKIIKAGLHLESDIFKAAHHGSKTGNSSGILNLIGAKNAVISCGVNNSFKHPHPEAIRNFKDMKMKIFRTDIDGRIEIVSNGIDYSITR